MSFMRSFLYRRFYGTAYLGVQVVFGEVSGLGSPAVSVSECTETLQPLGDHTGEPLLPRQLGDEEDVLGRIHLVRSVGTT